MLLAQMHVIDLVAIQQVDHRLLSGGTVHARRDSEDLVGKFWPQEVCLGEGQRKWVYLEEPQDGVGLIHGDVENEVDIVAIVEIRGLYLE